MDAAQCSKKVKTKGSYVQGVIDCALRSYWDEFACYPCIQKTQHMFVYVLTFNNKQASGNKVKQKILSQILSISCMPILL